MADAFGNLADYMPVPSNPLISYRPDDFELEALETINYEKAQWDDEAVYITDKVQYLMRKVIDKARKYYVGIFDKPKDEITGEDKVWVPLTEWSVNSVIKSVDLDTKDILIQPGTPAAVGVAALMKAIIQNTLKKMNFGQLLNDLIGVMSRDGTVVVKSIIETDQRTGKKRIGSYIVNLANWWIDPAAKTVHDSATIERVPMSESQIHDMDGVWNNTQYVNFSMAVPTLINTWPTSNGRMPYTEVWERWGKVKKSWITKDKKDKDIWVEGHIIASGLNTPKIIHLIRENPRKDGLKPYEEAWYKRLDGRWFGRGIAEMLFGLQEYSNTIVNIRKSNSLVLQNGIFLIRKGSGLTTDMISSISAGGGLPVTDVMKDVKQLQVTDFRQSSYTDEDRTYTLADRVTGANDINRGEIGRASASATATLTADRHIRDTFVLIQEGIGFFIERLIINQYIPLLKEILKTDDLIRVTGEPQVLTDIDNTIIEHRTNDFIQSEIENTGFYPDPQSIADFQSHQDKSLKAMGKQRFITYFKSMFDEDIDIDVTVTDERFNRVVAVQQLRDTLIAFSRLPVASKLDSDAIMREIFNLMGLKGEFFLPEARVPLLAHDIGQTGRQLKELPTGLPNEQTANANANGIPQMGQAVGQNEPPASTGGYPPFQERLNVGGQLSNTSF